MITMLQGVCAYLYYFGACYCYRPEPGYCLLWLAPPASKVIPYLRFFYPDHQAFWGGLLMGLPALAGFFLCSWRQHFLRLWHHAYWVLLVAQVVIMCQTARHFFQDDASSLVSLLFCVADSVAFFWWVTNPRLRRCFFAPME